MHVLARLGPAPADTADARGLLHAHFTDFWLLDLPDGADENEPQFAGTVYALWALARARGHGHLLLGAYRELVWGEGEGGAHTPLVPRPAGYRPLFALADVASADASATAADASATTDASATANAKTNSIYLDYRWPDPAPGIYCPDGTRVPLAT